MQKVAIIGLGQSQTGSIISDLSYKELMFQAALRAYHDAEIESKDVHSFICCSEDFLEGTSITDEYVPDQLGGMQKSVCTIGGNGLHGIVNAYMQICTGLIDIALVESHSKISDVLSLNSILELGFDPLYNRLGVNPHFIAGLEMNRFLYENKLKREDCADVVIKNKRNALSNPLACYSGSLKVEDVLSSEIISYPLTKLDISQPADACTVVILASSAKVRNKERAVWIRGVGWCNEPFSLEMRNLALASYAQKSAQQAYKTAKISTRDIHLAEVDDTYSYKELQHVKALSLNRDTPVNISGGSLGIGYTFDNSGLLRLGEIITQLRGEAGKRQLKKAELGIVQAWRGIPTNSGAVVILGV
jgi:acetyl-CoA C-acetyltransferase